MILATGSTPLISLKNAGIYRSDRWLVRNVSFDLAQGEILTLIGPNGSGKSTTAKMALGILAPDEGASNKRNNLKIRYVPQKVSIDWTVPLKVRRLMSLTGRVSKTEADRAMTLTGTLHLANSEVRTLSGGEFQRVLLARAIAFKPDLLVLDEPVQGVDFNGEIEMYELIRKIRDELQCGVLLISHDLHIVMAATDRVICLNGHVCCSGSPMKVAVSPEYKELFGARAASGLALYEHHHDHQHLSNGEIFTENGDNKGVKSSLVHSHSSTDTNHHSIGDQHDG